MVDRIVVFQSKDAHGHRLVRYYSRIVKRSLHTIVIWSSIFTLFTATDVAEAGPFRDFFRALRSATAHPGQKQRSHRSSRKHNEAPSSDVSNSETSGSPVTAPPDEHNVRVAKSTTEAKQGKSDLPYGIPVPGKQGLVTSPFSRDTGYIDVRGFPPGTEVKDPYTGKIFLTP